MRLRNKKTGEIKEFDSVKVLKNSDCTIAQFSYDTLGELYAEWEDYEEPKEYWCINSNGEVLSCIKGISEDSRQSIGNYFETKEEAEKAVEKIKAWKRLKDKGFINEQVFSMNLNWCNPDDDDWEAFHLLFGGEE